MQDESLDIDRAKKLLKMEAREIANMSTRTIVIDVICLIIMAIIIYCCFGNRYFRTSVIIGIITSIRGCIEIVKKTGELRDAKKLLNDEYLNSLPFGEIKYKLKTYQTIPKK